MRFPTLPTLTMLLLTACAGASEADPADDPMEPMTATVGSDVSVADRDAIVATVQTVFDALESGDADLLRSVMDESVVMHFWEERADGSTNMGSSTVPGLATRIESSEVPLIERMWDPEVRMSGALASVWTPYDFYAGPDFSHCGVDQVTLFRGDDGWRITALNWTRQQPPACELHPDGPPGA